MGLECGEPAACAECSGWSDYLLSLHTFHDSMRSDARESVMKVL